MILFPFLIGKVLTVKYPEEFDGVELIGFSFLIGKVLTTTAVTQNDKYLLFPFLIGNVLTQ